EIAGLAAGQFQRHRDVLKRRPLLHERRVLPNITNLSLDPRPAAPVKALYIGPHNDGLTRTRGERQAHHMHNRGLARRGRPRHVPHFTGARFEVDAAQHVGAVIARVDAAKPNEHALLIKLGFRSWETAHTWTTAIESRHEDKSVSSLNVSLP